MSINAAVFHSGFEVLAKIMCNMHKNVLRLFLQLADEANDVHKVMTKGIVISLGIKVVVDMVRGSFVLCPCTEYSSIFKILSSSFYTHPQYLPMK